MLRHMNILLVAAIFIFSAHGAASAGRRITALELMAAMGRKEPVIIIDVRTLSEYDDGHIPGSVYLESIPDSGTFRSGGMVVLYSEKGVRSVEVLKIFTEKGIRAIDLEGGIEAWKAAGGNVVAGAYKGLSEYPESFEIPKGVCEPKEPSMEIGK